MNLKHAQYIMTILQEGSITAAAKKLFISQPSLSQVVKLAETNLGAPVFNRSTDPISHTPAGEKYVEAAKQILAIQQNLEREIEEIRTEEHGKIRFGIPVQRGMQLLPLALPPFFEKYPHVDIEILEQGSSRMEDLVLNGSVDLACMTTVARREELSYHLLESEELVLLAAGTTDLAKRIPSGTPISITEAGHERFISNKPGHNVRTIQDSLFIASGIHPKILLETGSIEVEKKVCLACGAVMLCSRSYLDDIRASGCQASIYPVLNSATERHCYICHKKELYLTKYMRDFIGILLSCVKREQEVQDSKPGTVSAV